MVNGSCLCGAVSYEISGAMRDVLVCHCNQCRKTSGHVVAATSVPKDNLTITKDEGLAWYHSSDIAKRGFCKTCGSSLFWWPMNEGIVSVHVGAIDGPTGLKTARHIFTDAKGDYYDIPETEP